MTVEAMLEQIRALCGQVRNAQVRALLLAFLDDEALVRAFVRAPAAKSIHHAFEGGLCEHTLSVLQGASLLSHALDDPAHVAREARHLKRWLAGLRPVN